MIVTFQVLSLATQDADNPDLRDRGFIYWRLLSTDPAAAKEVVLAEKPLISEETDLLEPTLLDESRHSSESRLAHRLFDIAKLIAHCLILCSG